MLFAEKHKTRSRKRQIFDSSEKATEKAVFRRYKPQSSPSPFRNQNCRIRRYYHAAGGRTAAEPLKRGKKQGTEIPHDAGGIKMAETNTSGIITAAADIIAGAFNALPKRVCNQHKFSDYADYLHENLPSQAELDLQREKPLNPAPLVSVAIACSGASRAAVRSTLEALGKQTYANFEVCLVSELAQAGLTDYEGIPKFRLVLFNGTAYEQLKAAEKMLNGAYFLQLLPGDLPAPDALHMLVLQTHSNPKAEVVFADEDSVIDGIRQNPIFKPDYGRDTLRSFNSIGRPMLVAKRVHAAVGGVRGSTIAEGFQLR